MSETASGMPYEERVRYDERHRVADLIDKNAATIAEIGPTKERVVHIVALVMRVGELLPFMIAEEGDDNG